MSEMIELVAKAIQDKCRERGYSECPATLVHHVACAAIEAMREPTDAMELAAAYYLGSSLDVKDTWRAMIDEALK